MRRENGKKRRGFCPASFLADARKDLANRHIYKPYPACFGSHSHVAGIFCGQSSDTRCVTGEVVFFQTVDRFVGIIR